MIAGPNSHAAQRHNVGSNVCDCGAFLFDDFNASGVIRNFSTVIRIGMHGAISQIKQSGRRY